MLGCQQLSSFKFNREPYHVRILLRLMYFKGPYWALFHSLVYTNDIVKVIFVNIRLFADDTMIYVIVKK